MAIRTRAARFCQSVRRFIATREGNVAVIFALSSLPIVGLMGASVDYSRANATKADLQAALDATALMVSKNAATETAADLRTSADAYFNTLFKHPEASGTKITASYNGTGGSTVTVNGETTIPSDFISVIGISQLHINSSSTVAWGTSKLQVALVLDNTGSMAQSGKMDALKTASHNLLKQLQAAAEKDGDVQVAIVPFALDVNVGTSNKSAAWLDWSNYNQNGGGGWDSGGWSGGSGGGSWGGGGSIDNSKWQGCVEDRTQDYDVLSTTPTATNASTLFPAVYYKSCPESLMPLSYDWTALGNKIDAMSPDGNTNQTIGLAWGWQALSQGNPLNAPVPDKDTQQVVVLLTDGLNTQNRWTTNVSSIDARTQKVCNNIKAAKITLYTIQVKGNGDPTSQILQNCASDSKKFFALDSANQIVTTFNTIGTNLSQLRLAK